MREFIINSSVDKKELYCVDFNENLINPKCVLQVCHGMAEHIRRYENFAKFLSLNGIRVFGMDNRGHGKTGEDDLHGHIDDENGHLKLIEDVFDLNQYIREVFLDKKIFILGHSMGSVIVRNFLNKYSNEVDGAVICGTTGTYNFTHKLSLCLAKFLCLLGLKRKKSSFINKLAFNTYNSRIEELKTPFDWLTRDDKEVEKYMLDKYCGFYCTNSFFYDLISLIKNMSQKENISKIRKDLPIFFVSGKDDPVGDYGKGVSTSYRLYKEFGIKNCDLKLYDNMRHEILNEIGKEEVYNDILKFLDNN